MNSNRAYGKSLVVVGNSGAGKTRALQRLFRNHESLKGYDSETPGCLLVSIVAESPCTLKSLGYALLAKLGYPLQADRPANIVWRYVRDHLKALNVQIIHFDEFQNVTSPAYQKERVQILDTLKSFMTNREHPVSTIISGLPELVPFIRPDAQNKRRSIFVKFNSISANDIETLVEFSEELSKSVELQNKVKDDSEFGHRLLHAADRELGTAVDIIINAIQQALISESESLTIEHFALAYETWTGNLPSENPFLVPRWNEVDPRQVLIGENHIAVVEPKTAKKQKHPKILTIE